MVEPHEGQKTGLALPEPGLEISQTPRATGPATRLSNAHATTSAFCRSLTSTTTQAAMANHAPMMEKKGTVPTNQV